jgi:hypothetical protein
MEQLKIKWDGGSQRPAAPGKRVAFEAFIMFSLLCAEVLSGLQSWTPHAAFTAKQGRWSGEVTVQR